MVLLSTVGLRPRVPRLDNRPGEADTCGYCGDEFPRSGGGDENGALGIPRHATDKDWEERIRHLQDVHKFRECNFGQEILQGRPLPPTSEAQPRRDEWEVDQHAGERLHGGRRSIAQVRLKGISFGRGAGFRTQVLPRAADGSEGGSPSHVAPLPRCATSRPWGEAAAQLSPQQTLLGPNAARRRRSDVSYGGVDLMERLYDILIYSRGRFL